RVIVDDLVHDASGSAPEQAGLREPNRNGRDLAVVVFVVRVPRDRHVTVAIARDGREPFGRVVAGVMRRRGARLLKHGVHRGIRRSGVVAGQAHHGKWRDAHDCGKVGTQSLELRRRHVGLRIHHTLRLVVALVREAAVDGSFSGARPGGRAGGGRHAGYTPKLRGVSTLGGLVTLAGTVGAVLDR